MGNARQIGQQRVRGVGETARALHDADLAQQVGLQVERVLQIGDAGQRVSCTWVVATLGLAHIGRRDIAALEAEGRELEVLLRPAATNTPSSGAQDQHATPITSPTAYEASSGAPTASPHAPFADLDVRRIQMELKAPAAGLMFVAGLNLLLSAVLGVALAADGWGFTRGQFRAEPIEIAGAIAATIAPSE